MNKRRKTDLKESSEFTLANPMPDINRAHRDCERECIELRNLLARAWSMAGTVDIDFDEYYELSSLISDMLPATEDKKDDTV